MKAIVYTYQGEEFRCELGHPCDLMPIRNDELVVAFNADDGTRVYLRSKDIRAVITDLREDVPESDDLPSSDDAPQPTEPPEESSVPEGT